MDSRPLGLSQLAIPFAYPGKMNRTMPTRGIAPRSPALQAGVRTTFTRSARDRVPAPGFEPGTFRF